jgi:hypothetical protein
MKKEADEMSGNLVIIAVFALYLAVGFAVRGVLRSRGRRRTAERCAEVRRRALVRFEAGMAAGHPEQPGPPSVFEQAWNDDFYDFVRAQLSDVDVHGTNQSGDQG